MSIDAPFARGGHIPQLSAPEADAQKLLSPFQFRALVILRRLTAFRYLILWL